MPDIPQEMTSQDTQILHSKMLGNDMTDEFRPYCGWRVQYRVGESEAGEAVVTRDEDVSSQFLCSLNNQPNYKNSESL
ncbi:hypothetical protein EON64_00675 [archaeon]|nr:MAG: hypothetical protein EON64_00675 [archaeon]